MDPTLFGLPLTERRFLGCLRLLGALGATAVCCFAGDVSRTRFELPAETADKSLRKLSQQSGLEVVFATNIAAGVTTNAVKGEHSPAEAIRLLLAGTTLTATQHPKTGAFLVNRKPDQTAPRAEPPPASTGQRDFQKKNEPPTGENQPAMKGNNLFTRVATALALFAAPAAHAAEGAGGTIRGRVFNPATGEYVRHAEVRMQGTHRSAVTEADGSFQFDQVPAGEAMVTIIYTGYQPATATFNIADGGTAFREIQINSPAYGVKLADGTIKLQEFVVSSDREGNAKAIMEQRRSMNIVNSVSSDAFGDITEGNAGEFLKNIPGVELEWVVADIRGVRLRGMDPQYTSVTIDGIKVAGADGLTAFSNSENGIAGESVRSPGFEQLSLNSIESIEVSKTLSADMAADAPAGSINLKSKRAFDRKGRRIVTEARVQLHSEDFTLGRTRGPADGESYKIAPGGSFEYSDVFLQGRLGTILNINKTTSYTRAHHLDATVNTATTRTDPRPVVYNSFVMRENAQFTDRFSTALTVDLKASPKLVLSLGVVYNYYTGPSYLKRTNFTLSANNTTPAGRSSVIGVDPLMAFETSDAAGINRSLGLGSDYFHKDTKNVTLIPRLEYRNGNLTIEGKGSSSTADNTYDTENARIVVTASENLLRGINYRFERSDPSTFAWKATQLSGPDWSNLANYGGALPSVIDIRRRVINKRTSAQIDMKYDFRWRLLSFVKMGAKAAEEIQNHSRSQGRRMNYVGPGSGPLGSWAAYPSSNPVDMSPLGAEFFSISGARNSIPQPDLVAIGGVRHGHPEWFPPVPPTAAQYYDWNVSSKRYVVEKIPAGYLLANSSPHQRLQMQAGLRWEMTEVKVRQTDPHLPSEVLAAGFALDADGLATTTSGVDFQYLSKPRVWRRKHYDNCFPSFSGKYTIAENWVAHVGFNQAISRPPIGVLAGVWSIDEITQTIDVPNPGLLPEKSDNYSARLSYYLKPIGHMAVGLFQNDITNLRQLGRYTAEQFGYGDDPHFANYEFITSTNSDVTRRFRGLEAEYSQHLTFLPGILSGLNVSGSYVRNYASVRRPGLVPHRWNGAVGFKYRALNLRFSATWMDDTDWLTTSNTYQPDKAMYDVSGGYQVTRRLGLFFAGRNITNTSENIYQWLPNRSSAFLLRHRSTGAMWTFGAKATF